MIKKRPPRLNQIFQAYDCPLFFVTICTFHRRKIGDLNAAHRAFQKYIARGMNGFGVAVGRYVIMPDHMHFFVCGSPDFELTQWINGLKRSISVELGATKKIPLCNQVSSIIFCAMTKVTGRNGNMCARILFERGW
jgi:hypothetical protein